MTCRHGKKLAKQLSEEALGSQTRPPRGSAEGRCLSPLTHTNARSRTQSSNCNSTCLVDPSLPKRGLRVPTRERFLCSSICICSLYLAPKK
ncbi:hypothetical protein EDD17DRAFT_1897685 [Pisolithus thermaeus]|nr:hypothetical protein EDD17DRAFT_1897685 [Pisolithus thermaeus]